VSDNVNVSNSPTSINPDIPVRTIDKAGEQTQVVAIDYGGAGAEDLTVPDFATETTLASINASLAQGITADVATDILGVSVSGTRNNVIEISFFESFDSDVVTIDTARGGSATIADGHARFRTGTNATGESSAQSVYLCKYRPANEEYCFFTAGFTAPDANAVQRIGLYDTNNGFFLGYEGTSFGVTRRSDGTNYTTARASWNGDPLDGSGSSTFTRNGVPEAINFENQNLFRIRFAWLGSAPVKFEVLSPDESWVCFHTIRAPNLSFGPTIENPNLPARIEVVKTSGTADVSLYCGCMAAGTTSYYFPITETLNEQTLAALTRSVITGETTAGGGGFVNVKVNPSGALSISLGDIDGAVGQETMANSLPVVIASDQSAVPISDNGGSITIDGTVAATQSGTWNIANVTGTVSLPTGAATESTLSTLNGKVTACNTGAVTISTALPAGTNNIGDVDVLTLPSVVAATYSTSSVTSVVSAATSTSILASNVNRRMAIMVNDSDKNAYVKLGSTASATSFSYKLTPGQTLELPSPVYTGAIDAIWDASPTGSMRVTELT